MLIYDRPIDPWTSADSGGEEFIELPAAARILGVYQREERVWLIVTSDTMEPDDGPRKLRYLWNQTEFDPDSMIYIGTVRDLFGPTHVFEDVRVRES